MKILVRGANWIGDAVMTIPALMHLRREYPDASITLHTRAWAEGVFRDVEYVDEILKIDSGSSRIAGFRRQVWQLRSGKFDLAVLFPNSFESALVTRFAGIPQRLGYATERRDLLLSDPVPVPDWKNELHESKYYLNLIERFIGSNADPAEVKLLTVSETRRDEARRLLSSLGVDKATPVVGFGAGSTNSLAKRWPADNFSRLADLLQPASVVLFGAKEEVEVSSALRAAASSKLFDLTGKTDLGTATAALSEIDLFISNDMGLAHIAAAVGTPTIVIFGPTNELTTHPLGPSVEIIRESVECSPCMLRVCPIDHRCMTRITPERVFESAAKMLETLAQ